MTKKIICLLLAVVMTAGVLAACELLPTSPSVPTGTAQPGTAPSVDSQPDNSLPSTDGQPTESTDGTDPTEAPTDATEPATTPSEQPTEPSITPTEPVTEPTEPSTEPTEPPTEPVTTPTEPAPPVHTHSYSAKVTKPTCTTGGYTTHTCTCGDSYTDSKTATTGHSYKHTVTKPTCTAGGYTTHTCTSCGNSYTDSKTAVLDHAWTDWTVTQKPTTSAAGAKQRTCTGCGMTQSEYIPKLEPSAEEFQQEVLRLVNIEREKEGLAPLEYVHAIQDAADIRASEITQSFSHTRPDGSSCFTVLHDAPISYFTAGENIAYGYRTPEAVVTGWMNSPGHRANILNASFTGIVVGFQDYYWVQLFIGT